ncbi:MAG: hypothetical protein RQ745_13495 [Longimicrobiales bacterium]|nr:hypothetical protein [Longimicrobiales bacterium]
MRRTILKGLLLLAALGAWMPAGSLEAQEPPDTIDVEDLNRRIEAISRELEALRLGREVAPEADSSVMGFGPAASKVYRVNEGVSIGGYGEVLYENFSDERENNTPSGKTDQFDALRAIVYVGYKFNDRLIFNSEIEFEHASTGQAGSASLEFAYLDYMITGGLGVRAGLLLSPMGFLNELHEPPVFLGTERPVTENRIIPSTWRENGIGLFGGNDQIAWRAYAMSGFDGIGGGTSNASGFSDGGLRGGRQKGSKSVAEDLGVVGRVDYVGTLGLTVGTSAYVGNSGQNRTLDSGETVDARTFIWEGHADYQAHGLELRGLFALATVDDAEQINELKGFTGSESVGETMIGWYLQAGYNVLRDVPTVHQLIPYVRFEEVNTQEDVPTGFLANPANDETIVSLGTAWKPIPQVVFKADYQIRTTEADTGVDQFNVAIGYLF